MQAQYAMPRTRSSAISDNWRCEHEIFKRNISIFSVFFCKIYQWL